MTAEECKAAAELLAKAIDSGQRVLAATELWPGLSSEDAMTIQQELVSVWVARGRRLAGYKLLLARPDQQERYGTDEPAFAHLFADMQLTSGDRVLASDLWKVRVEPEIAFVVARDLTGPDCTVADILPATDYVTTAIELPSARMNWQFGLANLLADNGGARYFVLGPRATGAKIAGPAIVVRRNGKEELRGSPTAIMGDPSRAVAWLVNQLSKRGEALRAGAVVLTGSCTTPMVASQGDEVSVESEGIGSSSITLI